MYRIRSATRAATGRDRARQRAVPAGASGGTRSGPLGGAPRWSLYALAVGVTAVVVVVRVLLDQAGLLQETRFLLFALPIIVSAWLGGFGPGLIATLLCLITADYLFIEPRYAFLCSASR